MTKCIVTGAAGRMGIRIIDAIYHTEGVELVGATEVKGHPRVGSDVGTLLGMENTSITLVDSLEKATPDFDVLIDFTSPESSLTSLEFMRSLKRAAVIGTTGFSSAQTERIKKVTQDIPCVCAPNMSVGINLMFTIIRQVAQKLKDEYDIEIIESHHRLKKDAPSGTAVEMAHILADATERELDAVAVHQRKGLIGARRPEEIGIQVIRAGDIVGEHTVLFGGPGERLEITHRAHSRDTFARGAVRAAQWVVIQQPGLYDMLDVLALK
jgi:4-hydroxy-tetrahydrodipicolinate reductase